MHHKSLQKFMSEKYRKNEGLGFLPAYRFWPKSEKQTHVNSMKNQLEQNMENDTNNEAKWSQHRCRNS